MTGEGTAWDRIYASGGYGSEAPDEALVELVERVRPGRALDLGAGEGRHALLLAARGFEVTAVDISPEGMRLLEERARKTCLTIRCETANAADFDCGQEAYDLVVSAGFTLNFFRKVTAAAIIGRLKAAVSSGGYVYVAVATVDDPGYQRHRSRTPQVEGEDIRSKEYGWVTAFRPGELALCFADFDIVDCREEEITDTHGRPHTHMQACVVARRPDGWCSARRADE